MSNLSKKKVIALTGSIGSGKSQVSYYLKEKKYPVIDCDEINAKLLERGEDGYNELVKLPWIELDENQNINKIKMATNVFSDLEKKKLVESILHPLIFKKIDEWKEKQTSELIFVEVPILFEIQAESRFDEVWCVCCDLKTALYRLETYRNFTKEDALARIENQLDPLYKREHSDVVIENNGTLEDLIREIETALKEQ